ncbi:MAG: long-chain fatty acid--CoA ligase [Candidatus Binatia bacterium]|nr:long-chain fatty acid--CoA ligase [Candidatus Binatia bacterium]
MDLSTILARRADFTPHKVALGFEGRCWSYAEFCSRIERAAAVLSDLGLAPGERIAVLAQNLPATLEVLFACARLGAVLVPLNWRLAVPEHRYILHNCTPTILAADSLHRSVLARAADGMRATLLALEGEGEGQWLSYEQLVRTASPAPPAGSFTDPVALLYTSGTTGNPKGAILTQSNLVWNAHNAYAMHEMTSADVVLTTLPLFHTGGLNIQTVPALLAGASVYLQRKFDPDETLTAIATVRPTLTLLVPTQMQILLAHPQWPHTDLTSLRLVGTGSSLVPEVLIRGFAARGLSVVQVYGATETGPISIYLTAAYAHSKIGSTGKPAPYCEVRIVDATGRDVPAGVQGEIWVRGPAVSPGYWGEPPRGPEAWFATGDVGHRDSEGFYYIDDRIKDMIISGGENISPAQVENVLYDHPAVAEAAVIGIPDPQWIEIPIAIVVRRDAVDAETLIAHCRARLAHFKAPRAVFFVDSLPRNAMGKVQKFKLREMFGRQAAPDTTK